MKNPELITLTTALIAALISIVGIIVNYFVSRKQIRNNTRELFLKEAELKALQDRFKEEIRVKAIELDNTQKSLERELEELKQNQLQSIINKRLEAYPELWSVHIKFETNWTYEKRKKDKNWAEQYVNALNAVNIKYGLFFTQDLYAKFFELRKELYLAIDNADKETHEIPAQITTNIRRIVYGHNGPGLSTIEKDDLGSYINVAVAKRK
ncbi:MAG: hypothetical protein K9H16_13240 [Bacteroidales bacterium]|nr:hypothetical protein [Bacteroidales bacterium]